MEVEILLTGAFGATSLIPCDQTHQETREHHRVLRGIPLDRVYLSKNWSAGVYSILLLPFLFLSMVLPVNLAVNFKVLAVC